MSGTQKKLEQGNTKGKAIYLYLCILFILATIISVCIYCFSHNSDDADHNEEKKEPVASDNDQLVMAQGKSLLERNEGNKQVLSQQAAMNNNESALDESPKMLPAQPSTAVPAQEVQDTQNAKFKQDYDAYVSKSATVETIQAPISPPENHNLKAAADTRRDQFRQALMSPTRIQLGAKGKTDELMSLRDAALSEKSSPLNNERFERRSAYRRDPSSPSNRSEGNSRSNMLDDYKIFDKADDFELANKVMALKSPWCLRQGSVIPAVLLTAVNSDLPGLVTAQTTTDVLDSVSGSEILIPKGTRITGEYASSPGFGQDRLFIGFQRLLFPDGSSLNLGAMPGQSADGSAGFETDADHHLMRMVGSALLLSTVSAAVSASEGYRYDENGKQKYGRSLASEATASMGSVLSKIIERNLSLSPTLNVKPGYVFAVAVTKDIYFTAPWGDENFAIKNKEVSKKYS